MAEIFGYGLAALVALAIGSGLTYLIDRGYQWEQQQVFDDQKRSDLAAVRSDPERYKRVTPVGILYVGPEGRVFRVIDVFPPEKPKLVIRHTRKPSHPTHDPAGNSLRLVLGKPAPILPFGWTVYDPDKHGKKQ